MAVEPSRVVARPLYRRTAADRGVTRRYERWEPMPGDTCAMFIRSTGDTRIGKWWPQADGTVDLEPLNPLSSWTRHQPGDVIVQARVIAVVRSL